MYGKMSSPSLHVLGIPHTLIHPYFNICSFTKNTWSWSAMMKKHTPFRVIYYGAEESREYILPNCHEFVSVIGQRTIFKHKPSWLTKIYDDSPGLNAVFKYRCEEEIKERYKKNDIIIHTWFNYPLSLPNYCIQCCINIGCFTPVATPFRSYVSYSCMSINLERQKKEDPSFYDRIIPPTFDVSKYPYCEEPQDYFVYLGRIIVRKGINIIIDLAKRGFKIVIMGPTNQDYITFPEMPNLMIFNEVWDEATKLNIIAHAKALICPTLYNEPFGMISPEAQLCGTPVISSDWGGFTENNINGVTGWRCRSLKQFIWACANIDRISRRRCREEAISRYSFEKVSKMYLEWFNNLYNIYGGKGFYEDTGSRDVEELEHLSPLSSKIVEKIFPPQVKLFPPKKIPYKPQNYLNIFKNCHEGKKGWLLCTGPGLNSFKPPSNLSDQNIYFGVNSIIFHKLSGLVDYYFIQDPGHKGVPQGWTLNKEKYKNFKPRRGKFYSQYIPHDGTATPFKLRNIKIINKQINGYGASIPDPTDTGTFNSDVTDYINSPGSVSFTALQFMLFMGITDIQIVGVQPHINADFKDNSKTMTYKDLYHYDYWHHFAQWLHHEHPKVQVTVHNNDVLKEIFDNKENVIEIIGGE